MAECSDLQLPSERTHRGEGPSIGFESARVQLEAEAAERIHH